MKKVKFFQFKRDFSKHSNKNESFLNNFVKSAQNFFDYTEFEVEINEFLAQDNKTVKILDVQYKLLRDYLPIVMVYYEEM